jgi:hypothetical protein
VVARENLPLRALGAGGWLPAVVGLGDCGLLQVEDGCDFHKFCPPQNSLIFEHSD